MLLAQQACLDAPVCRFFLDQFHNEAFARFMNAVLAPWPQIILILVVAALVRGLARRLIRRFAGRAVDGNAMNRLRSISRKVVAPEHGGELADVPVSLRKEQRIRALVDISTSIVSVVIWTIAVMMIMAEFGLDLGPMIASAGIVGVALGFGAQDLVKDFLSGVFMLAEDQYGVGDVIDAGEATGVVEEISLRTTSLRSVDGTLWHIPNGEIRRVGNMSQGWARTLLDIGVGYGADIPATSALIQQIADEMAHEDDYRLKFLEEPQVQGVQDLGPDAVVIRLIIKTTPGDQWGIARELRLRIKQAFDAEGVEIPFPQRTVWLRPDGVELTASEPRAEATSTSDD